MVPAVLLVHDHPDVLDWLTTLLEAEGYGVAIGATAFAARAKLERAEFVAVLAGIDVGGGAGRALLSWIDANHPPLRARTLLLTSGPKDVEFAQAEAIEAAAADDYEAILAFVAIAAAAGPPTPVRSVWAEAARAPNLLVVEDDPHQSRLMSDLLAEYGFRVFLCESVAAAKSRILEVGDPIDLVLSDWILADGDAEPLYHWLLDERPSLAERCIFISGGSMREIREKAPLASSYPKGQDSRLLIAALTRAARRALS